MLVICIPVVLTDLQTMLQQRVERRHRNINCKNSKI